MKRSVIIALVILYGLSACKKEKESIIENAGFATATQNGEAPKELESIQLVNTSPENCSYLWNFGNGTASSERNPAVSYKMHGTYTISLEVINSRGVSSIAAHDVTIRCRYKNGIHTPGEVL